MREVQGSALILALDPGGTTGWVLFDPDTGQLAGSGEARGREALYQLFDGLTSYGRPLVVVCEKYTVTARTAKLSQQTDALKIIGMLEYACAKAGIPLHEQTPAQAKLFSTDEKLTVLGWYKATEGGHTNDAIRHLLRWLIHTGHPAAMKIASQLVDGLSA